MNNVTLAILIKYQIKRILITKKILKRDQYFLELSPMMKCTVIYFSGGINVSYLLTVEIIENLRFCYKTN